LKKAAEEKIKLKKVLLGELPEEEMPKSHIKKKSKEPSKDIVVEKPAPDIWIIEKPTPLTALQDDVIKLSAKFVARNGRSFQTGLVNREHRNPLFGFLQPFHPHHAYFKKLVSAYIRCLIPEKGQVEGLQDQVKNKQGIIDRMLKRVYYERAQKKTEDQKKKDEEAERTAMAMIDWHEFVVVQTIEFDDEEVIIPEETEDVKTEEKIEEKEMEMEMDVDEELPKTDMRVRYDYDPRSQLPRYNTTEFEYRTPSGQKVSGEDINEHMKIELSDPNVIEKRKMEELNEKDSGLNDGVDVTRYLEGIATKRTDIFGDEELLDIGRGVGEEKKKKNFENSMGRTF